LLYQWAQNERTLAVWGHAMLTTTSVWKKKREDLKSKRKPLFEQYAKHPNDFHLALEIKTIDDEIAQCTEEMEQEMRSEAPRVARGVNNRRR